MGENLRPTRVQVRAEATYYLKGSEAKGLIVDISEGGIGMEVKQIVVAGDLIRVKFNTDSGYTIDFWGIVRNVTGNFIGIKYEEISNESRKQIDNYVTDLLRSRGLSKREFFEG